MKQYREECPSTPSPLHWPGRRELKLYNVFSSLNFYFMLNGIQTFII